MSLEEKMHSGPLTLDGGEILGFNIGQVTMSSGHSTLHLVSVLL